MSIHALTPSLPAQYQTDTEQNSSTRRTVHGVSGPESRTAGGAKRKILTFLICKSFTHQSSNCGPQPNDPQHTLFPEFMSVTVYSSIIEYSAVLTHVLCLPLGLVFHQSPNWQWFVVSRQPDLDGYQQSGTEPMSIISGPKYQASLDSLFLRTRLKRFTSRFDLPKKNFDFFDVYLTYGPTQRITLHPTTKLECLHPGTDSCPAEFLTTICLPTRRLP